MNRRWATLSCTALALFVVLAPAGRAWAAARPSTHTHPLVPSRLVAPGPLITGRAPAKSPTTSANWSGYDATGGLFTSVTATWNEPAMWPAGTTVTDAAFWVGLDGDTSSTVEQIGSEGYNQGGVGYDAWYELYPAAPVTIPMMIRPGDLLTGTVSVASGVTFTLSLVDHTSGVSFQTVQTMSPAPALSSAEVIAEAPTDSDGNILPLANFGLVSFSSCAFDGQPIGTFNWDQIDMTGSHGALVAKTSALGPDGASFTITSDLTPPTTKVTGAGPAWHNRPVTLHFKASDNPGGTGVAYTEYSLDGGATWTMGHSVTIPAPADHTNDGAHTILYRSADKVGNLEKTRSCTVNIDTRRPTPVAKWAGSAIRGARTALRFYIGDPRPGSPTATVTVRIVDSHDKLAKKIVLAAVKVDTYQNYIFTCWLPRGTYRFLVYATDAAGNRQTHVAANRLVVR
jgi:hypothetical protein